MRLKVDVIVTTAPAVPATKQVTSVVPIVFALAGDPVGTGLIQSLARPGGNVTGLSIQQTDTAGKRLELLREVVPGLRRLAIMANVDFPDAVMEMREVQETARAFNFEVSTFENPTGGGYRACLRGAQGPRRGTLCGERPASRLQSGSHWHFGAWRASAHDARFSGLRRSGRSDVLWTKQREPVPTRWRLCRQDFARGEPAEIPVEQPTKFDLVVNLITAQALGLTVPSTAMTTPSSSVPAAVDRGYDRSSGPAAGRVTASVSARWSQSYWCRITRRPERLWN